MPFFYKLMLKVLAQNMAEFADNKRHSCNYWCTSILPWC